MGKKQPPPPPRKKPRAKAARKAAQADVTEFRESVNRAKTTGKEAAAGDAERQRAEDRVTAGTLGEVAIHFGVHVDTVRKSWRPNWGDSCGGQGAWDLAAIAAWRTLSQSRSPGAQDVGQEDVQQAQAKKILADARIKEAEAARKERLNRLAEAGVVFREDVESFLSEFFRFLRDGVKGLIEDSKPEFPAKIRQQLAEGLQERASALLRSLKNQAEKLAELDDAA